MQIVFDIPSADYIRDEAAKNQHFIDRTNFFVNEIKAQIHRHRNSIYREAPLGGLQDVPEHVKQIFRQAGYQFKRDNAGYGAFDVVYW